MVGRNSDDYLLLDTDEVLALFRRNTNWCGSSAPAERLLATQPLCGIEERLRFPFGGSSMENNRRPMKRCMRSEMDRSGGCQRVMRWASVSSSMLCSASPHNEGQKSPFISADSRYLQQIRPKSL